MERRASFGALDIIKRIIRENVKEGDMCIDATAGRGNDTVLLCSLVGENGRVLAFDIQPDAVESTKERIREAGYTERATVISESHSNMDRYAEEGSLSCITFNFGWLPGGDHHIFTTEKTSIPAIQKGLKLLKKGGIMTLILYYGRETGYTERDAILSFLPTIDPDRFTVIEMPFVNRRNCPPIPVIIRRDV